MSSISGIQGRKPTIEIIKFTNSLVTSFYHNSSLYNPITYTIMLFIDCIHEFKSLFLKRAMGLAGYQPRLVRGLNLLIKIKINTIVMLLS